MGKRYRLAVLNSHPIQYFAPLYRRIAASPDIEIMVYYCSRQGMEKGFIDPGFGKEVVWDIPLLDGYPHKFLPNVGGDRGVHGFFSLINLSIVAELWRGEYDAILIHGHNLATNLLALFAAKIIGTRVFIRGETHLLLSRRLLKRVIRRPIMQVFFKFCDACLYIGTLNRAFYRAHGVPEQRLFFVPYTVDNDFFVGKTSKSVGVKDKIKTEIGISNCVPLILYASKLIARKRPLDLLKAYERLRGSGTIAALLFIGEGPERPGLQAHAINRRVPDVHFLGFKNQTELPKYYAIADVFVLPSEDEPWGLIINEVMCAGVPVITTSHVGAAADLVLHGKTGFVFDPGDIDSLSRYLETILTNPDSIARFRSRSLELIRDWNYDTCIKGIRNALESRCEETRAK